MFGSVRLISPVLQPDSDVTPIEAVVKRLVHGNRGIKPKVMLLRKQNTEKERDERTAVLEHYELRLTLDSKIRLTDVKSNACDITMFALSQYHSLISEQSIV